MEHLKGIGTPVLYIGRKVLKVNSCIILKITVFWDVFVRCSPLKAEAAGFFFFFQIVGTCNRKCMGVTVQNTKP